MESEVPEGEGSIGKRATKTLYSLYLGYGLGALINIVTFIFMAKALGAEGYGLYVFAMGFLSLLGSMGNFGIGSYLASRLSAYSYKRDAASIFNSISSGFTVLITVALLLFAAGALLSGYLSSHVFSGIKVAALTLIIVSAMLPLAMIYSTATNALIGLSRGKDAGFVVISVDALQLMLIILLITNGLGVNGALIAIATGYAAGSAALLFLVLKQARRYGHGSLKIPNRKSLTDVLEFSAPLGAKNALSSGIQNFGTIFLGIYLASSLGESAAKSALGNYGVALKSLAIISILYTTMGAVLLNVSSAVRTRGKEVGKSYNMAIKYSVMITIPLMVYIGVFARQIISLFLSSQYLSSVFYVQLMAAAVIVSVIGNYINDILVSAGFTRKLLYYYLFSAVIELISLLALVPYLGASGAIIALFMIGGLVNVAFSIRVSRKFIGLRLNYSQLLGAYASNATLALGLFAISMAISHTPLSAGFVYLITLATGAVVLLLLYPALLIATRAITRSELTGVIKMTDGTALAAPVKFIARYIDLLGGRNGR